MDMLVISGSTRAGSHNTRLAHLVGELRPGDAVTVVHDLVKLPFFDGDLEALGIPPAVATLRSAVADADAVIVVTPEYNGTVPGVLGNAVDWLSRPPGRSVLRGKRMLVLSASPSRFGAVRAAEQLRSVLSRVGALVTPSGLSVAAAHQRLGPEADPQLAAQLSDVLARSLDALSDTAPAHLGPAAA